MRGKRALMMIGLPVRQVQIDHRLFQPDTPSVHADGLRHHVARRKLAGFMVFPL